MATLIINSDSESKLDLLLKLAEELGLSAEKQEVRQLATHDIAFGIGRKATNEEMDQYLAKGKDAKYIDLDEAFSKYSE